MMDLPVRRSVRLPNFDYSARSWYFVTLCIQDKVCRLGKVVGDRVFFSPLGHVVNWEWLKLRSRYPNIELDEYVVMPNHAHFILRMGGREDRAPTLGKIVAYYKYQTTKQFNQSTSYPFPKLWQRNYYEHIVRDNTDPERIRRYIRNNPAHWTIDKLRP